MAGGNLGAGNGQGADLVSEILSEIHRDVMHVGEPDGDLRAAGSSMCIWAMRQWKMALSAFTAALARQAARWGQTAGSSGAANLLLLVAGDPLSAGQTAIDNNCVGALGAPLGWMIAPAVAAGESGGKGGD